MAVFGYARVSSTDQNLDRQIEALKPYITDSRYLYCDKASGKDFERKAYRSLVGTEDTLPALHEGDMLVILSIDRLGRNYDEIREQWAYITHTLKCDIKVLDMPLLDTSVSEGSLDRRFMADLVLQILSYVATRERESIRARQREGIDIALSKGIRFGKKPIEKPDGWDSTIALMQSGRITATEAIKRLGLKRTTFYRLLKK